MPSEKALSSDNQQGTSLLSEDSSETTSQTPFHCSISYLQGAIHDATLHKNTVRISQKNVQWLKKLQHLLKALGHKSWIYKEGKLRNVFVLETVKRFFDFELDPKSLKCEGCMVAYVRGFFDAEGGVPHSIHAPLYIQLSQKDEGKIKAIKSILERKGIMSGKVHNPSVRIDPDYWRIFISRDSLRTFISKIGSWHPAKQKIFSDRMKIWSMPSGDRGVKT